MLRLKYLDDLLQIFHQRKLIKFQDFVHFKTSGGPEYVFVKWLIDNHYIDTYENCLSKFYPLINDIKDSVKNFAGFFGFLKSKLFQKVMWFDRDTISNEKYMRQLFSVPKNDKYLSELLDSKNRKFILPLEWFQLIFGHFPSNNTSTSWKPDGGKWSNYLINCEYDKDTWYQHEFTFVLPK